MRETTTQPATTPIPWQYDPLHLVMQWDAHEGRMAYYHPTPPWRQDHGPRETLMGHTLASAQEMCRLENLKLAQRGKVSPRKGKPQSSLGHPKAARDQFEDRCHALIAAIIGRAVQDAQGHVDPRYQQPREKLVQEARQWLLDGREVRALLDMVDVDADEILPSLQQVAEAGSPVRRSA